MQAGGLVADTSGRKRAPAIALQGSTAVRPLETQVAAAPSSSTQAATAMTPSAVAPASPAVPVTPVPATSQFAEIPMSSIATTPGRKGL